MKTGDFSWFIHRGIEALRYEGLYPALWRVMMTCLSPLGFIRMITLYKKDLTEPLGEIATKVDLTVAEATEGDVEELSQLVAKRYGPSKYLGPYAYKKMGIQAGILERLRQGRICFTGRIGGKIVHYNWVFFKWKESAAGTKRYARLRNDEAYLDDAYTSEAWRGKGIHSFAQNQMLLILQRRGIRRVYTAADTDNRSSRKTHRRLKWENTGTMLCFMPRGSNRGLVWCLRGCLEPFTEKEIPTG